MEGVVWGPSEGFFRDIFNWRRAATDDLSFAATSVANLVEAKKKSVQSIKLPLVLDRTDMALL